MILSGSQGFIGSTLLRSLPQAQFFEKDITDIDAFKSFLMALAEPPQVYFHMAGISSLTECSQQPDQCQLINTSTPVRIAKLIWEMFPSCVFVFPSTAHIYAEKEGELLEDSPISPKSLYAHTKLDAEYDLKRMQKLMKGRLAILRLFNHTHKSQPPHFFLSSMYQQMLVQKKIDVGNIEIARDIGAVQDLIDALVCIAQKPKKIEEAMVFNICSGVSKNLKELLLHLAKKLNRSIEFNVLESRVRLDEPKKITGNSGRFQNLFSWTPSRGATIETLVDSFLLDLV